MWDTAVHIPIIIHLLKYFLLNIIFGNADMAKVPLLGKQLSKCSNRMSYYTNILQIECFTVQTKPILLSEQVYFLRSSIETRIQNYNNLNM